MAARDGKNITLYSSGGELVLVLGAYEAGKPLAPQVRGECHTRRVASSGIARAVLARYSADLRTFTHLRPEQVLDASITYAEAGWRWACRRAGRRVA